MAEGQGARLLPQELDTIRQHRQQTSNSSSLILAALLADHDALAAENIELRAALEDVLRMTAHSLLTSGQEIERICRAALMGRADGGEVQDG
jgi:cell division protein ZapA (FtsZ GTPase activity inhibitor)